MSELAGVTQEVHAFVAQIGGLERPIRQSRDAIARARESTARQQRDPRVRREAMERQAHLERADHALRDALQASSRAAATAQRWLAQHAASGGGAGVGGDRTAGAAAGIVLPDRDGATSARAAFAQGYQRLADRHGQKVVDGFALGAIASFVTGAFHPALKHEALALIEAIGGAAMPPPVGMLAALGITVVAHYAIHDASERLAHTKDAGVYSNPVSELWELARHRRPAQARWTAAEWAAAVVVPAGLGGLLLLTSHATVLGVAVGSLAGGMGWGLRSWAHRRHGHTPPLGR